MRINPQPSPDDVCYKIYKVREGMHLRGNVKRILATITDADDHLSIDEGQAFALVMDWGVQWRIEKDPEMGAVCVTAPVAIFRRPDGQWLIAVMPEDEANSTAPHAAN